MVQEDVGGQQTSDVKEIKMDTDEIRHWKNEGADAARRALRGRLNRMRKQGALNKVAADIIEQFLDDGIVAARKRIGGLGPKKVK